MQSYHFDLEDDDTSIHNLANTTARIVVANLALRFKHGGDNYMLISHEAHQHIENEIRQIMRDFIDSHPNKSKLDTDQQLICDRGQCGGAGPGGSRRRRADARRASGGRG